ncbi:hypothetical protein HK405_002206, partial [Cladochytrium tenue]
MKQNSPMRLNPRMIDNIVHVVRVISQCPEFNLVVREPSVFPTSVVDIVSDVLRLVELAFNETPQFLAAGPVYRAKTAVNTAIVIDRMSTAIAIGRSILLREREGAITAAAIAAAIEGSEPVRPSMMFDPDPPGLAWDYAPRRSLVIRLRDWHATVEPDLAGPPAFPGAPPPADDSARLAKLRRRVGQAIGVAAASLFSLGDMFGGEPIPQDLLGWMAKVEAVGYRVFTPAILYNYENALGTVLAHSYSARDNVLTYADAIFEQVLPRYEETEDAFLAGTTVKDDEYVSIMHALPTAQNTENPGERKTLIFP